MGRNSSQQLRSSLDLFPFITKKSFVVGHKFLMGKNPLSSLYHIFKSQVFLPRFSEPHVTVMWWSLTCIPKIWAFFNGLDNSFSLPICSIYFSQGCLLTQTPFDSKLQQEMFFFVAVLDHFPCSWDSCFNLNKIEGEKKKIRCWGLVEQQTLNGGTAEEEMQV